MPTIAAMLQLLLIITPHKLNMAQADMEDMAAMAQCAPKEAESVQMVILL